ncbi:MAG: alpha/beta hydrolase [Deltaproteobacteria bacterium]|nr:alpha/beta hydrolase [Deltaproteobacteria bacterium]MBW2362312.1 alpha/beta hydrolase [Deltaproteobacteria bacterium]
MSRANEYLPIDGNPADDLVIPMTDDQRERLDLSERFIPGPGGAPDVRVLVYRPKGAAETLPVLLHLHGGAFCFMHPENFAGMEAGFALDLRCVVVSVDYRLAPAHPFPAGPEDCYAALLWTVASAVELGIDPGRLVVTGGSAGGALSAALCLMTRDRGGPKIAYQGLMMPVLDDRLHQPSHKQAETSEGFSGTAAIGMWLHYLGEDYDREQTSPYAAPARAHDLTGLPPTFIQTNGLDPLRDEGVEFALRLMAEGIDVELYNAPGTYHGADPLDPRTAAQAYRVYGEALGAALQRGG